MEVSAVGGRLPRKARRSMMERSVFLGLDIGSTTAKLALVAADGKLLEAQYLRHGAAVRQTLSTMLDQLALRYPGHGGFGGDHRFRVPWALGNPRAAVRAGSRGRLPGHRRACPANRRGRGTRRRRRQDPLPQPRHGSAHERSLRGRHRGVHRSDGGAAPHRRLRAERACRELHDPVPHRFPLRGIRQDRRGPSAQRGGRTGRPRRLHLSGRGRTDHRPGWPAGIPSGARSPSSAGRCTFCPNSANASSPRSSSRPKRWCRSRTPNIWSRSARP